MLDLMEVMDRGLQLQSGETGVSKALKALNASQDHFESILALEPNVYGSTVGTFTTTADTESSPMPTPLMRLDRLQYIDWSPVPDAVYTIRYYGFVPADDITASGTFSYPDMALMPMATFATQLLRSGKDDDVTSVTHLGMQVFSPVIQALGRFNRDRAPGYDYRYTHST